MESLIIFIIGFLAGITILGYWELRKEEKNHDRDYKNTQGNKEGDPGLYLFPPEKGAESGVPGSSTDGKSLDKAAKEAIRSRDYAARYCNETDCIKCCFGDGDGGCSLISGPPCMWAKKGVSENGI